MKKITTLLLAISLCLVAFLGGCSCASTSPLTFTNAFYGSNGQPTVGYKETLTYKVSYVDDKNVYPYNTMSQTAKTVLASVDYDGSFITEFEVLNHYPTNLPKSNIVGENGVYSGEVYRYKTKLNVNATYTLINGEVKEFTDSIVTEVYFLPSAHSFAPIYSTRVSDMTLVFISNNKADFGKVNYDYKTTYNLSTYTIDTKVVTGAKETTSSLTYAYSYKTAIDNNQLLFALRSFDTPSTSTVTLSVIDPTYGTPQSLGFKQSSSNNQDFNFTYNEQGALDAEKLPIRNVVFAMNNLNATGYNHYLKMQVGKSTNDSVKSKALLVQYAMPLVAYGSISSLGVMQYDLQTAIVNE